MRAEEETGEPMQTDPQQLSRASSEPRETLAEYGQANHALLKEEVHTDPLQSIVMTAPVAIYLVRDRVIAWVSHHLSKLTGYSGRELVGQSARILYPEDGEYERVSRLHYGVAPSGFGVVETRWLGKDRGVIDIELRSSPVDPNETAKGMIFAAIDIGERKRTLEALRESEARYRAVVEDQTELVSRFLPDKTLTFVNEAYCRYFGEAREDLLGRSFWHHVPVADRAQLSRHLSTLDQTKPVATVEHRVVTKNNEIRWQQWTDRAIFGEDGRLVEIQAVGRDITERKVAEEALKESERKYRLVVDHANDGIVIVQNGAIRFSNPTATEIAGYSAEELADRPFIDLIYPADRDFVLRRHLDRIEGKEVASRYSFRVANRTGRVVWVEVNAVLVTWEGLPATLNFVRDTTEQRALEAQLRQAQKMEAIGTLAGGIAHDFNNILAAVLGFTELTLADVPRYSPMYQNLQEVLKAAHRARDLVRQILVFSRMRTGQEREPVNLCEIIEEAVRMMHSLLPGNIVIHQQILSRQGRSLVDAAQIHQVLVNLFTNAAQAMEENGGELTVSLTDVDFDSTRAAFYSLTPGPYLRLSVGDTGHGMDSATLERIFDPYFTTKGTSRGSGLGLAVVHGIVKHHEGAISVQSEVGKGATFHIFLPRFDRRHAEGVAADG